MLNTNDTVKFVTNNKIGKIIRISNNKQNKKYTIELDNNSKIQACEDDIELIENINYNDNKNKVTLNYSFSNTSFENEIMIRHQTVLEAIENVDRFISSCIINKEKRIKIIHGRHGGILRDAVHEYLKNSPFVESFKLADEYEGSIGVTIVYLK